MALPSPTRQTNLNGFVKGSASEANGSGSKTKRPRPDGTDVPPEAKKSKGGPSTYKAFPANPPEPNEIREGGFTTILAKLEAKLAEHARSKVVDTAKDGCVVYWQRMKDIRLKDNKALSLASETAIKHKRPLVILHVLSTGDFVSHDRGPARIDFVLRNLRALQDELDPLNIPLAIRTLENRKTVPQDVLDLCKEWKASHIFANLEYEVDELRRDISLLELVGSQGDKPRVSLQHDYVLVVPGIVKTGQGKQYSVFSPFHRNWSGIMSADLEQHSKEWALPEANDDSVRTHKVFGELFKIVVPESVPGFEMPSKEFADEVHKLFPVGTDAAEEMLQRFFTTKTRKGYFAESPLADGAVTDAKESRLAKYSSGRNEPGFDGVSRLS